MVWLGAGLHPLWPLMWFAPLPVLVFAGRASRAGAALVAAAAWLAGMLDLWHALDRALHVPAAFLAPFFGGQTLAFVLGVLLYRALLRRGAPWAAIAAFAAARVAFEYLLALVGPHGTVGSLAYTQLEFSPFLQLASITGPWGMTFVLVVFPATVATAWHLRGTPRRARRIVGAGAGAVVAVLGFGAVRFTTALSAPAVTVGLVASDPPTSPEQARQGAPTAALLGGYARSAAALAAQGAQVIVLPEKIGTAADPELRDVDTQFQAIADRTGAMIVLGLVHVASSGEFNEARIYAPGAAVQSYHKHHMIPAFESNFEPGRSLALVPRPLGTLGVEICKDLDFAPLSRSYGQAGVDLLLVPAWDFGIDAYWHGHIAVMRGVESGFSIVRAAKRGYLTVSDDRGRILAETTSDSAPFATMLAHVHATHHATVYLALGDWFAWLSLALLAAALVRLARLPARCGAGPPER
jgi:apolipoprotein N-acyltransferase